MANLNLTYSGNMNITSAELTSAGTIDVQYEPNNTGAITGWSFIPDDDFVSGQTYSVNFYPNMSGTVLTENFTVSGYDEAGVLRSDTSVLRQGYDDDYRDYLGGGFQQLSANTPRNIPMQAFRIDNTDPGTLAYYFITFDDEPNYVGDHASIMNFSICPDEGCIVDNGYFSYLWEVGTLVSGNVYDYIFSQEVYFAGGEANAPYNQVWYQRSVLTEGIIVNSSSVTENCITFNFTVTGDTGEQIIIMVPTIEGSVDALFVRTIGEEQPGPDTGGTVITSLELVVADSITSSGQASAVYESSASTVSLVYTSSDTSKATIDPVTGVITVVDTGTVTICVQDRISGLASCKTITVYKDGDEPETGSTINFIAISVPAYIVDTATAITQYSPSSANVDLHYSSALPAVANINETTGEITVYRTGNVTFCVRDSISGLYDCMTANVTTTNPDPTIYATAITINVDSYIINYGQATTTVEPSNAERSLYYTSTNPEIAEIDRLDGSIIVRRSGRVGFCVEERITGLVSCKTVYVEKSFDPDTGSTEPGYVTVTYEIPANEWSGPSIERYLYHSSANWNYDAGGSNVLPGYIEYSDRYFTPQIQTFYAEGGGFSAAKTTIYRSDCQYDSERNAFYYSVIFEIANREIPDYGFSEVWLATTGSYTGDIRLRSISFSDNFEYIGPWAFDGFTTSFDLVIPAPTVVGTSAFEGMMFNSVTLDGDYYHRKPNGVLIRKIDNSAFAKARYLYGDDKWFNVYVDETQKNAYLSYYQEHLNENMCSPWEGWVELKATGLTINVNNTVRTGDVVTATITPSSAVASFQYSSSDSSVATVDNTGYITVLSVGTVAFTVTDTISNLTASKTASTTMNINGIVIEVPDTVYIGSYASAVYTPSNGEVELEYYVGYGTSDATINPSTGEITVLRDGTALIGVVDNITGLYSEKYVTTVNEPYVDYSTHYLTFEILSNGTISWNKIGRGADIPLQYSKDAGYSWYSIQPNGSITVSSGDTIYLRYDNSNSISGVYRFGSNCLFNVAGNIKSLGYGADFTGHTYHRTSYSYLFANCGVVKANHLILQDNGRANNISGMFSGCSNLIAAPELPATSLTVSECYSYLFSDCTSLASAPVLPASVLSDSCYEYMFSGCISIQNAPVLYATQMQLRSCYGMFNGCTSLVSASNLPALSLAESCYEGMFEGCTALENAPALPATALAERCYYGMFGGCTSLETAPDLPATTLVDWCYATMFANCTSLDSIKCLATDISASACTLNWVSNVGVTGTFAKNPSMTSWTTGQSGVPTNWTVINAT